jgi:mono/diheme cytochrome c family protein
VLEKGQDIFREVCFACHGFDGKGMPMDGLRPGTTLAPPLSGSATVRSHRDAVPLVLLSGLTGPTGGKTYDAQMVPMNTNDDEWIAAVASYVRNSFGNHGAVLKPEDVKRLRAAAKDRKEPWTVETLLAALPKPLDKKGWKITASENGETAALVADGKTDTRWQTAGDQKNGQWIQVELPQEATIGGIRLDQWKAQGDYPKSYKVEGSLDGRKWTSVGQVNGLPGVSEFYFAPAKVRFVKVTLAGAQKGKPWSIYELDFIQPNADTAPTATARN